MVAGWIILMQMVDMYVIVMPAFHGTGVHVSIWDFVRADRDGMRPLPSFSCGSLPQDIVVPRA